MVIDRRDTSRVSKGNRSFSRIRDFFFSHGRFMLGCVAALISTLAVNKRLDVAVRKANSKVDGFYLRLNKKENKLFLWRGNLPLSNTKVNSFSCIYFDKKKRVYLENARKINFRLRLYILILFYLVWTISNLVIRKFSIVKKPLRFVRNIQKLFYTQDFSLSSYGNLFFK